MTTVLDIIALASMLLAFFWALIWIVSSVPFVALFDWTQDHPVISGIVFSLALATVIMIGR